jgi:hypothetical protein
MFIELKGSLSCSQEYAIGPYYEPDESSMYNPIFNIILQPTFRSS